MNVSGIGQIVRAARAAAEEGRAAVIATIVASNLTAVRPATRVLVFSDGQVEGSLAPELVDVVIRASREALQGRRSQLRSYSATAAGWQQVRPQTGQIDVFFEVVAPAPRLIIVGAGHIAVPLAQMASLLDFRVVIVDDRAEYATVERFPRADEIVVGPYRQTLASVDATQDAYVVLVTRGHVHDQACLELMLELQPAYVGMIGSQRRVRTVMSHLREKGYDASKLKAVFAPVGIAIAAQTPAEIALAIMAEIVNVRRGGKARSLALGERLRV